MNTHLDSALAYARLGWRVHPCRPGEKLPILDRLAEARDHRSGADRTMVGPYARGQRRGRDRAWSGIFVLDVDGPEGERALVDLERRHGALADLYPQQWTGSGRGWQAFFAWPEGREIRNSAGRLGPKLDTRGAGGYAVLPPSLCTRAAIATLGRTTASHGASRPSPRRIG